MPTESTFLFAGLLFLAAGLGYVFARFGDTDEEEEAEQAARANYLRGFRYLLNEEPDRAVDVFTGAGELSDDAMETQLALGTLFRRRGEVDRAIRLHQDLVDRPASSGTQRQAASFALAEDYLSAGLFDRAEELFVRLRESRLHGVDALQRLLRIAEVTSDWDRAVDLCAELQRVAPDCVSAGQRAHYYCELAELARHGKDLTEARQLLGQAEAVEPGKIRTALVRADLEVDAGMPQVAIELLAALAAAHPLTLGETLPRLLSAQASPQDRTRVAGVMQQLAATPEGLRGIALGVIRDPRIIDPLALKYLMAFVDQQATLRGLAGSDGLQGLQPEQQQASLQRIRAALHKLTRSGTRYQCGNCGYGSAVLHWQCPGCRAWDTVQPLNPALLEEILG